LSEGEVDNVFIESELRLNAEIRSKVGDSGENNVLNFFSGARRCASFLILVDPTRNGSLGASLREDELEGLNCARAKIQL